MILLFCADPLAPKLVDPLYQLEADAADRVGLEYHVIDFEALLAGQAQQAVRRVPQHEAIQDAVFRGWMLKPEQYRHLYEALLERGIRLINDPDMYRHAHYLPENYPVIEQWTARSVWLPVTPVFNMSTVHDLLSSFGDKPVIVKDYVKSQKHYWHDAFYIPNAADQPAVERVVGRFLELQGDDLNEGLVFREFVEFEPLSQHARSGMPLTKEFRAFFWKGNPLLVTEYWSEGDYQGLYPPLEEFVAIARKVNSQFFTMDIALRNDGTWMIVELGDGQVAGLPQHVNTEAFYRALREEVAKI